MAENQIAGSEEKYPKTAVSKKEIKRQNSQRKRFKQTTIKYALGLIIILLIGFGLYWLLNRFGPQGPDLSQAIPIMADISHIPVGQSQTINYNSNPPTSGPHYNQTAQSGWRQTEIADGHIIHNLEHGDIWISYHPRLNDEIKDQLRQFAAPKVIITPRSANQTDIALAAWGRLDRFDLEDNFLPTDRIKDFILRHMHKGPERVPGSSGGI